MTYWKVKSKNTSFQIEKAKETLEEVLEYPIKGFKERGIFKSTMEKFGVRCGVSEEDGLTPVAFYFPSYNQKGKLTGFKKQDLSRPKEEKGHWSTVGSVTVSNKMFGQDVAEQIQRKRNNLVVTEGEWDCLSTYQACIDDVKGTKYEGLEPFVCSIPLGTANAVEAVLHNEEFVKSFDSLTIFFDDDYCTPAEKQKGIMKGHEAREAVAGALVGSGLSLMTISTDSGMKDASDYLQAGRSSELAKLVSFGKRPFSAEKIVHASDITFEELITPQPRGVVVNCFPKLMERLNGFRSGELTLFIAPSGVGKTAVSSILAHKFMEDDHKLGMIFLEEGNKETLQRLVALDLGVNFMKFRRNPTSVAKTEKIQEAYDKIANNNKLSMLDHFGSLPVNDLMNKIKHMHLVDGCKYIVLDHISMVISGLASDNERKDLDVAMTNLAAFCASNDVHILVISHINRTDSHQFLPPKGKEGEPFWVNVRKESARGSAALEQLSWNIIGLEPEIMPDFSRGRVRLKVLKTRFGDSLGIADVFTLDEDTWEVLLSQDEELLTDF